MDLSIVIVSFNTADILENCLSSVKQHTLGITYEVIVVDNASLDGSPVRVREKFPQVMLLENSKNLGFATACNQGIKKAEGEYVLLLNSDTLLLDNSLKEMVDFLQANPKIGGLNPKLLNGDGTLQIPGNPLIKKLEEQRSNKPHTLAWVSGAAAIFPRKLLLEIGLLDEKFFFYNEDLDLSKRIRISGYLLYYYPSARIIHLGGKSTEGISGEALWYGYQGGFYYCKKHYGKTIKNLYKTAVLTDLGLRIAYYGLLSPFVHNEKTKDKITAYQRIFKDAWGGRI